MMSVTISLAFVPRGAASSSDIGRDHLNALIFPRKLEDSSNTDAGILRLFSHDVHL